MAFAQSHAVIAGTGGTSPSGPVYVRAKPRRLQIASSSGMGYLEFMSTTSLTKSEIVALAADAESDIPVEALAIEGFEVASGGAGFSGPGFGGLPGQTKRFIIPLSEIADDATLLIEIGAPGIGQAGGKGTAGGMTSVRTSNNSHAFFVHGGQPGEETQELQRSLHTWALWRGIQISDLGQLVWADTISPTGPSSSTGPGGGAHNLWDEVALGAVYLQGGFPEDTSDWFYACGYGGDGPAISYDMQGTDGYAPGGGGGASSATYPGGTGGASVVRLAIVVMETVNE